jgi:uncharacterized protein (DUF1697 family)
MMRLVAFLRGINVGGHIVKKEKLQEAFVSLGFQNVSTYRQSGNVVFETDRDSVAEIQSKIEKRLCGMLGYEVVVFIRSLPQLKSILEFEPFKGREIEGSSFLVTFLPRRPIGFPLTLPYTIPKSTAQLIAIKDMEGYSVTHGGGEGALPNPFIESKLKTKTTTRNVNVIRELLKRYGQD